jgi:hypothetical protein
MAGTATEPGSDRYLAESLRRFCRSIELCDDYLRGYYGLKLVSGPTDKSLLMLCLPYASQTSSRLLKKLPQASRQSKLDSGLPSPDIKIVERLNETATAKLSEIVRRSAGGESGWEGYDKAEVIAARELLNRDSSSITR